MTKRIQTWLVCIALLALALAVYWWVIAGKKPRRDSAAGLTHTTPPSHTVAPDAAPLGTQPQATSPPASVQPRVNQEQAFLGALLKPIIFWGKVVDHSGNLVGGATVEWSANNNPNPHGSGTKGRTGSDANGVFSITSHGIGLYVNVSKDGYYRVPTERRGARGSSGGFSNGEVLGNTDSPMGTRSDPAVFVLHKKGETVPLVKTEGLVRLQRNGTPAEVSLKTGKSVIVGQGDIRVEAWTQDGNKDAEGHYNWRCRISVPGGGLLERVNRFDFEAPADGYRPFDEIDMPKTAERWSPQVMREYFIKLPNNTFARIQFEMVAGGDHFFSITSFFEPAIWESECGI